MSIKQSAAVISFLAWHLDQIVERQKEYMDGEVITTLINEFETLLQEFGDELMVASYLKMAASSTVDYRSKPH